MTSEQEQELAEVWVRLTLAEFCEWAEHQREGKKILAVLRQVNGALVLVCENAEVACEWVEQMMSGVSWLSDLAQCAGLDDAVELFTEVAGQLRLYVVRKRGSQ